MGLPPDRAALMSGGPSVHATDLWEWEYPPSPAEMEDDYDDLMFERRRDEEDGGWGWGEPEPADFVTDPRAARTAEGPNHREETSNGC